jgi:hypothetical protein
MNPYQHLTTGERERIFVMYEQGETLEVIGSLDYSPRYLGHEIASGRSESNVWSVANTD